MDNREYIKFKDIKFFWHPKYKYYLASKCGKILSLKRKEKRILKFGNNGNNYLIFCLCEKNKKICYLVHRYVFETFKGEIPCYKQVDHVDFDRKNNSINNLQLLSPKENSQKSCCKKVISFNLETKEKKIFESVTEVAKFYQICISTVTKICQKIRKTSKSKRDGQRYKFFYL